MGQDRFFAATILVLLVATILLHVLGAGPLRDSAWGIHFYAFLPTLFLPLAGALALTSLLVLRADTTEWTKPIPGDLATRLGQSGTGWAVAWRLALFATSIAILWVFREGHLFMGDASIQVVHLPQGSGFHERQPLTGVLQQQIYRLGTRIFEGAPQEVAGQAIAMGSVFAGGLFVLVAVELAKELLTLDRREEGKSSPFGLVALVFAVLFAQGYVQLFFGHVENYTFLTLATGVYLWTALRFVRGASPLVLPGAVWFLTVALHLSGGILGPSFVVLVVWALLQPTRRRRALRDLALLAVIAGLGLWGLSRLGGGYDLVAVFATVAKLAVGGGEGEPGYILSRNHLRDFSNEQLLLGPMGLPLFLAGLAFTLSQRPWRRPALLFLFVVGLTHLGASWVAGDSNLGYARNWDLLAPGGLVFATAGLGLFLARGAHDEGTSRGKRQPSGTHGARSQGSTRARRASVMSPILVCALAASLFHTVPWIAVNASFDRSFERLKALPLGKGRTETNVARWYLLQGDVEQARTWLMKSLEVNPNNNNAYFILGTIYENEGRFDAAGRAFGIAVELRRDKMEYKERYAGALLKVGRYAEAIPSLSSLVNHDPQRADWCSMHAVALAASGEVEQARSVFDRAYSLTREDETFRRRSAQNIAAVGQTLARQENWGGAIALLQESLRWDPNAVDVHVALGHALVRTGRVEEATVVYGEALRIRPDSEALLYNLGSTLFTLGRRDEAKIYLQRLLVANPRHAKADAARRMLGQQ